MKENFRFSVKFGFSHIMKYASERVMVSMKNVAGDPRITFHVSVTTLGSLGASLGAESTSHELKIPQNEENPQISGSGSTGRQDGAPLVAIGSATKFRTFHQLSVLGLETMQKKFLHNFRNPYFRSSLLYGIFQK